MPPSGTPSISNTLGDTDCTGIRPDQFLFKIAQRPLISKLAQHINTHIHTSPLPTTASPTLKSFMKGDFGEAVFACDMPEPCKFPSLDSCHKRFPWTHKEVDLVPYSVVGLVLQAGDAEKFPQALGFHSLGPFFQSQHI